MRRIFKNEGADVFVRHAPATQVGRCGIVEMICSGCVVGFWEVVSNDGEPFPEFRAVGDRLTSMRFGFDIMDAVRYGQKLAEVCIDSIE